MNHNLKDTLNSFAKASSSFFGNLASSIASLFRMVLLSKISIASKTKKYREYKSGQFCCILANGPSLKEALANGEVRLEGNDIFCVNMFAEADVFWTIKPRFYFLVDREFFCPSMERTQKQVAFLKEAFAKVDWDMFLCISGTSANSGVLSGLDNPHIKVLRWNTTDVGGFRSFRHFFYRRNMGMPRCQTVTNFALTAAIAMKYENVFLYGADHGWTKDLRVDDENVVCYGDRHIYNTSLTELKLDYSIATLLRRYAMMFEAHWLINDFAKSEEINILNCTKGSFVDAYKRLL